MLYYTVLYGGEARTAFHENDNTNSNGKDEYEKEERKMEICRSVSVCPSFFFFLLFYFFLPIFDPTQSGFIIQVSSTKRYYRNYYS